MQWISSLWKLIIYADDPFLFSCGKFKTNSGKRFVAAYRAHAGVYHKVFAGVDNTLRFALRLRSVFFGPNRTIVFGTDLVTLRALLCHCCCRGGSFCQSWGHRDARDRTLGQFGASRCGWRRGIQNLYGVGFDQPARSGGVVAVSEGKDIIGAREFVNEVLDAASPVQVGAAGQARGRPLGGGQPESVVFVAEGPLRGGGLGRRLKKANTTTSIQYWSVKRVKVLRWHIWWDLGQRGHCGQGPLTRFNFRGYTLLLFHWFSRDCFTEESQI